MNDLLFPEVLKFVNQHFQSLSKPLRGNLAVLTMAFLSVLAAFRSGAGRLSLSALARALPMSSLPHSRENRLARFLANPRLESRAFTTSLVNLLLANRTGVCPILLDQTKAGNTQALVVV